MTLSVSPTFSYGTFISVVKDSVIGNLTLSGNVSSSNNQTYLFESSIIDSITATSTVFTTKTCQIGTISLTSTELDDYSSIISGDVLASSSQFFFNQSTLESLLSLDTSSSANGIASTFSGIKNSGTFNVSNSIFIGAMTGILTFDASSTFISDNSTFSNLAFTFSGNGQTISTNNSILNLTEINISSATNATWNAKSSIFTMNTSTLITGASNFEQSTFNLSGGELTIQGNFMAKGFTFNYQGSQIYTIFDSSSASSVNLTASTFNISGDYSISTNVALLTFKLTSAKNSIFNFTGSIGQLYGNMISISDFSGSSWEFSNLNLSVTFFLMVIIGSNLSNFLYAGKTATLLLNISSSTNSSFFNRSTFNGDDLTSTTTLFEVSSKSYFESAIFNFSKVNNSNGVLFNFPVATAAVIMPGATFNFPSQTNSIIDSQGNSVNLVNINYTVSSTGSLISTNGDSTIDMSLLMEDLTIPTAGTNFNFTPFSDSNYFISLTPTITGTLTLTGQTKSSFTVSERQVPLTFNALLWRNSSSIS